MTRIEEYLKAIVDGFSATRSPYPDAPVWHEEAFYDAVLSYIWEDGDHPRKPCPVPVWRSELFLKAFYDVMTDPDHAECPPPTNRIETYWKAIFDHVFNGTDTALPEPAWREEEYLKALYAAVGGGEPS